MTHVMPRCCQVSTSTPPRGSATLPGSVAHPEVATLHHRKSSPRGKSHNTIQHNNRARLQHSNI